MDIKQLDYYDFLSEEEKKEISFYCIEKQYENGETIYGYNDDCLGMIMVLEGSIRVYISSPEGKEITLFHIEKGNSCILSASCAISELDIEPQMITDEATKIMAVSSLYLKQLIEENVNVKCYSYKLSVERLQAILWAMEEILFKHMDQRIAGFLVSQYEKTGNRIISISQERMAMEINSAREVVSRMLKQFSQDRIIRLDRNKIEILKMEKLRDLL